MIATVRKTLDIVEKLREAHGIGPVGCEHIEDGLVLKGAMICAVAHCAPPGNKPTPEEIHNCASYLTELLASRRWRSVLCLGGIAWEQVLRRLGEKRQPFGHGQAHDAQNGTLLVGSYHPSQQNTFTGRLTEEMLDEAVRLWLDG